MYPCRHEPDWNTLQKLVQLSESKEQAFAEFLVHKHPDKPIYLFTRIMAVFSVKSYELILDHIRQPSLRPEKSSLATDNTFLLALGALEDICTLQYGLSTRRWAWQLYGFIQWQPLAVVLGRLSVVEFDTVAEHAWDVSMRTLSILPEAVREKSLWQPLCKLI